MTRAARVAGAGSGRTAVVDAWVAAVVAAGGGQAGVRRGGRVRVGGGGGGAVGEGRGAGVGGLLGGPGADPAEPGRARWERAARANVAAELAQLTAAT